MKLSEIPAAVKQLAESKGWRVYLDCGTFTFQVGGRRENFYYYVVSELRELDFGFNVCPAALHNARAFDAATGGRVRGNSLNDRRARILRRMLLRTFNLKGRI